MPNQRIFPRPTINKKEQDIIFGRYKSANFFEKNETIETNHLNRLRSWFGAHH